MSELLSMPIPFASSLVVLAMVAAFFFIKFLVLALSLDQEAHSAREVSGHSAHPRQQFDRRMGRHTDRRSTDHGPGGGSVALS
jgi:hypothetical protein